MSHTKHSSSSSIPNSGVTVLARLVYVTFKPLHRASHSDLGYGDNASQWDGKAEGQWKQRATEKERGEMDRKEEPRIQLLRFQRQGMNLLH